ncbi:uncharacterized protein HMPREF1541_04343 [Cyphellophora europaea CBS 101466]|uniref:Carrier domain-containing protein n=1 Tax=Cyphellophora europaea (strain CBS 101466) TaxID=1220924 RepID=W2RWC7_CYPE1|nr:uncharacterized protein HMPREF1541_04343 [Cyphellophora europaea CBS 101466]ETN40068.1 hypothetical protein HMPREF1541_04343 [Cyphellophora europaea CBS 101466]
MSTTVTLTAPVAEFTAQVQSTKPQKLPPAEYRTIDGLLKAHAAEPSNAPLLAYPVKGVSDFEEYTGKDLDRFTDAAVAKYISHGIAPVDPSLPEAPVMALLAPSSLEVYISIFALNRLGYAILFLSTRLAAEAYIQLMIMANCDRIIAAPTFQTMVSEIQKAHPCSSYPLLARADYRHVTSPPAFVRSSVDPVKEGNKMGWIIHSSGSTGFPKPIILTNMQCLANFYKGLGLKAFCVSPLFHSQALMECGRALYARKPMYLGNYAFPVTAKNLIEAMSVAKPELFNVVPYVLKLMAETEAGIAQLQKAELVLYAGSACPDALGNRLVAAGINLVANYGATETGFIMNSSRPAGDLEWDYMRLHYPISKHVLMDEISPGVFECVGLDGLPSKGPSNSDDPPNSFRTRDLFTRHPDPAKSNFYKYLSRLDDRLTLVNSEKVLPLPIEGRIRQDRLVGEAAVFGAGRSVPGVIVFRNAHSAHLSDADFLSAIQPSIDAANAAAESFSRIPQELIIPMHADVAYPKTDKGTFIRAQLYQVFATAIDAAYAAFEDTSPSAMDSSSLLELSIPELESFLMSTFATTLNTPLPSPTSDIFSCGIDSLQTTRLYSLIRKHLSLGDNASKLSTNVVFETGNVAALARHLYSLRTGEPEEDPAGSVTTTMQELISQYSVFTPHEPANWPTPDRTNNAVILLTGCTGSLGAYIAASLLSRPGVSHVYALVRAPSAAAARTRVLSQLHSRGIDLPASLLDKLTCLPSDLSLPTLGLSETHLTLLRTSLTHVIHCAWPVNFNLPLPAFAPSLASIQNLINLCTSVQLATPAAFYFCSSVSAASGTPRPAIVRETRVPDLAHAQTMGYGQAKLCGERITEAASSFQGGSTRMQSRVMRVGQLSGDLERGAWNATEAVALLVRCAAQDGLRCLPRLDERVSWLPVDVCAEAIVVLALGGGDVARRAQHQGQEHEYQQEHQQEQEQEHDRDHAHDDQSEPDLVYNVLNPHTLHWTYDVLPALRRTALLPHFDEVSPAEWLRRLREASQDAEANPSLKLLGFWEGKYGHAREAGFERGIDSGMEGGRQNGLEFETVRTVRDAPVVASAGREVLLKHGPDGYVSKLVGCWLKDWGMEPLEGS